MSGLVKRIEPEPLARGDDRRVKASRICQRVREAVQQRGALSPRELLRLALPVVEPHGVAEREPCEQVAAVQRRRSGELLDAGIRAGGEATRLRKVEERAVQIQSDVEPVGAQAAVAEGAAKRRERAPQRRSRALAVGVRPQQFGDSARGWVWPLTAR